MLRFIPDDMIVDEDHFAGVLPSSPQTHGNNMLDLDSDSATCSQARIDPLNSHPILNGRFIHQQLKSVLLLILLQQDLVIDMASF
jgi:hypothetical protein